MKDMRIRHHIVILVITVLLLGIPSAIGSQAYADTTASLEIVEYNMVVAQHETYSLRDVRAIYPDGSLYNFFATKNVEISVSDDTVLQLKHNENSDLFSIEALAPGKSTLTIANGECTAQLEITVADYGIAVISRGFPEKASVDKGSWLDFGAGIDDAIIATINMGEEEEQLLYMEEEDFKLSASNDKVIVDKRGVKGVKKGTVDVTLTITSDQEPDLYGKTFTCKVTVIEGPKAKPTTVISQSKTADHAAVFYNHINVGVKYGDYDEFQIWYSTKKDSGYKKLPIRKCRTVDDFDMVPQFYMYEVEKNLKANTKYYFKVRVRYRDEYHNGGWSKYSKPKEYWTAAKPISDSKVKFNKKTRKASWKKTKGAVGYVYTIKAYEILGKNIFGQDVIYIARETKVTKKNNLKTPKKLLSVPVKEVENVKPITKHGKYYFVNGEFMKKKTSAFKVESTGEKSAV